MRDVHVHFLHGHGGGYTQEFFNGFITAAEHMGLDEIYLLEHKRIFEIAARKANLELFDLWYCGDNGISDVDGAEAVGLVPVWYKGAYEGHGFTPKSECMIITDWLELQNHLEVLHD